MGGRRPRARDARRRPPDARRGHRGRPARRAAPGVPRRPVRPRRRSPRSTGAGCSTSSGPGRRSPTRPDRYRASIERLTVQDIAVFFQEALAELPQLVADLARGGRVVDIHCGGGRWLIAMARRFPALELVGVEFEPDSVARARANVAAAGLADRIEIRQAGVDRAGPGRRVRPRLLPVRAPPAGRPGRRRCAPPGRRCAPGGRHRRPRLAAARRRADEFRTRHGELIAGVQLDELYQGTALVTRERFLAWFAAAGLPGPILVDLPSGASAIVVERPTGLTAQLTVIVPFIGEWMAQWNGYVPAAVNIEAVRSSRRRWCRVVQVPSSSVAVWAGAVAVREGDDVADLGRDRGRRRTRSP